MGKSLTFRGAVYEATDKLRRHRCRDPLCDTHIWRVKHELDMARITIKHLEKELEASGYKHRKQQPLHVARPFSLPPPSTHSPPTDPPHSNPTSPRPNPTPPTLPHHNPISIPPPTPSSFHPIPTPPSFHPQLHPHSTPFSTPSPNPSPNPTFLLPPPPTNTTFLLPPPPTNTTILSVQLLFRSDSNR
ncbi:hypothetical protein Pcinc_009218 [Petrolisthes cinctipes]|uniref:Uncharacterized protein n=1 Tax=Petrolisthes cinctipes TaxID=88211 RepID=A0AAE1G7E1_PETCI|nr:hypothetical protein Pcinc_009218 [Petrolisthes cinctipes]